MYNGLFCNTLFSTEEGGQKMNPNLPNWGWRRANESRYKMSPFTKALVVVGTIITLMVVVGGGLTLGLDWVVNLLD